MEERPPPASPQATDKPDKPEYDVDKQFMLTYVIVCSITLSISSYLTYFSMKHLLELRRANSEKYRHDSSAMMKRAGISLYWGGWTMLQLLAVTSVCGNQVSQLFFFEYYVLQRALMSSFSKRSLMFPLCRLNLFLYALALLPYMSVICFWYARISATFGISSSSSLSSGPKSGSWTGSVLFWTLLLMALACIGVFGVWSALTARDINRLKSRDVNPFVLVNPHVTRCSYDDRSQTAVRLSLSFGKRKTLF